MAYVRERAKLLLQSERDRGERLPNDLSATSVAELRIVDAVNDAHAALAQLLLDAETFGKGWQTFERGLRGDSLDTCVGSLATVRSQ